MNMFGVVSMLSERLSCRHNAQFLNHHFKVTKIGCVLFIMIRFEIDTKSRFNSDLLIPNRTLCDRSRLL